MTYLLDTHILLWTLFDPTKLSRNVLDCLQSTSDEKVISAINLWEISIKYSLGKLDLGDKTPDHLLEIIQESGFTIASIDPEIFASYYHLPKKENHRDPFDRMLIWHTIKSGFTLITHDGRIEQYLSDGLLLLSN
jgi:PIN domain nuclease of toxin-antitoxin system